MIDLVNPFSSLTYVFATVLMTGWQFGYSYSSIVCPNVNECHGNIMPCEV